MAKKIKIIIILISTIVFSTSNVGNNSNDIISDTADNIIIELSGVNS